jgi:hypothetical protein
MQHNQQQAGSQGMAALVAQLAQVQRAVVSGFAQLNDQVEEVRAVVVAALPAASGALHAGRALGPQPQLHEVLQLGGGFVARSSSGPWTTGLEQGTAGASPLVVLPDGGWPQGTPQPQQQPQAAAAGGRAARDARMPQGKGGHTAVVARQQQVAAAAQPSHDVGDVAVAMDDALSGSAHGGRRHPAAAASDAAVSEERASHSGSQHGAAGARPDAGGDGTATLQLGLPPDLRSSGRRPVTSMMRLPGASWCCRVFTGGET